MILGISGKIGSGKDTIGQIVQYLTDMSVKNFRHNPSEQDFNDYLRNKHNESCTWKIKKYADKLKDIVCLLISCTREQLEDQNFKNKKLGEKWWYWYGYNYKLITNLHNGRVTALFSTEEELIELQKLHKVGFIRKQVKLTPRKILQLLGTECGRNIIHPNIWVNSLFSDYYPYPIKNSTGSVSKWIITDMRFPNELKAVKDRGGITIRVNRQYENVPDANGNSMKVKIPAVVHESETALDNAEFDYVIDNNSSIDDLISKVKEIMIKEKLI